MRCRLNVFDGELSTDMDESKDWKNFLQIVIFSSKQSADAMMEE
jgi:hypothetical protein